MRTAAFAILSVTIAISSRTSNNYYYTILLDYHYKIGEKTYLGLDTRDQYRIEIKGLALGSFTLAIDEVFDDQVVDTVAYMNIPVMPQTKATFTTQTMDTTSSLSLDVQGDGTHDLTFRYPRRPIPKHPSRH